MPAKRAPVPAVVHCSICRSPSELPNEKIGRRPSSAGPPVGEPESMRRRLPASALLELLLDHTVQVAANPLEVQPLRQRLLLLHGVQRGFHDICRVETRRERPWREFLECRHELKDFVHSAVDPSNVVELPIPERI